MAKHALERLKKKIQNAPESLIQTLYFLLREAQCEHGEIIALLGKKAACIRIDTYPTSPELKSRRPPPDTE
jgi:hypothetical protein